MGLNEGAIIFALVRCKTNCFYDLNMPYWHLSAELEDVKLHDLDLRLFQARGRQRSGTGFFQSDRHFSLIQARDRR